MSNITKIKDKETGVIYPIEDSEAREEISDLKSAIASSQGMSAEFKQALENLVGHVAFIGDDPTGQTYINALHTAMYPPANLNRITAVYTQSGTVYDMDSLDDLKADLVVTAYYSDGTSEAVTGYVLSGTLSEGTRTITVSYGGKTATFNVVVTQTVPSTYTRHDYISVPQTGSGQTNTSDAWINLASYDNLDALSYDITFFVESGYVKDTALFGSRMDSSSSTGVSVYIGTSSSSATGTSDKLTVVGRNSTAVSSAVMNVGGMNRLIYRNTASSPSKYTLNEGSDVDLTWGNNLYTVTRPITLFTNPTPTSSAMVMQDKRQIGNFKLYALDGTLVSYYVPVIRNADNVVGMFDIVTQTFYTASSVKYATIGNTSCRYAVGDWS